MANSKNKTEQESEIDNKTLLDNIEGLEREKAMLIEQKERAEQEKTQASQQLEQATADKKTLEDKIALLEAENQKLKEDSAAFEKNFIPPTEENVEINSLKEQISQLTTERDQAKIDTINALSELQKATEENKQLNSKINKLQNQETGIILEPFVKDYLNLLAQKLSKKFKKDVTPAQIVSDYIIRYNLTERWTEWFHPWVMTEQDAITVMKQFKPEVKSFKEIQYALNIK